MQEIALEKEWVEGWSRLNEKCQEAIEYFEIAVDENDTAFLETIESDLNNLNREADAL